MNKALSVGLDGIKPLAKKIAQGLSGGEIFALTGTLGAGKTTFVKAVGKELKIRNRISSPTFILLQAFEAKLRSKKPIVLYHLDLYRTKNFKEAKALGLTEFWGRPNTVTFIEWGDKIKRHLPAKAKIIQFSGKQ